MSRGRRDVLRYLTILLVSGSTMTTLSVRSLLTKSSPVCLASTREEGAIRNAIINPNVNSFSMRMSSRLKHTGWKYLASADSGHAEPESMAGLVPATPIALALRFKLRGRRDKPGDDTRI